MGGRQGDIGVKGNFIKSTKRNIRGFSDIEFQHKASLGDTGFNLLNLTQPSGIVNPNPNKLAEAIKEGNLSLFNGEGRDMASGTDFVLNGTSITFIDFTSSADEIFHGVLRNSPEQGSISLLDGVALSPRSILDTGQDTFNIGRSVKIPTGNEAESIIVFIDGVQQLRVTNYDFVSNGSGFSQIISLVVPGTGTEEIQVFANGFIVEKQPTGVNAKFDQFRGQLDRIIDELVNQHSIDPNDIRLGAPVNEDLKFFGDQVIALQNLKIQIKKLASDVVGQSLDIAGLRFNNLVIGKRYKIGLHMQAIYTAGTNVKLIAVHNSVDVLNVQIQGDDAGPADRVAMGDTLPIFTATATTVVFDFLVNGASGTLEGDGSTNETFVSIEELPNHTETTDFT